MLGCSMYMENFVVAMPGSGLEQTWSHMVDMG